MTAQQWRDHFHQHSKESLCYHLDVPVFKSHGQAQAHISDCADKTFSSVRWWRGIDWCLPWSSNEFITDKLALQSPKIVGYPSKKVGLFIKQSIILRSLPESVGCLKQLVYLSLAEVPIKRLLASFKNLAALQILDLQSSEITELLSDLHRLRSLSYLDLDECSELKCLPYGISSLTSLQCLYIRGFSSMTWVASTVSKR